MLNLISILSGNQFTHDFLAGGACDDDDFLTEQIMAEQIMTPNLTAFSNGYAILRRLLSITLQRLADRA